MPSQESNHLSCGLEPRFKLLITPVIDIYLYYVFKYCNHSTFCHPDKNPGKDLNF